MLEKSTRVVVRNSRRANICIELLRLLYRNCKSVGKDISSVYRKSLESEDDAALTYGEILPASFIQILQLAVDSKSKLPSKDCGRVFVDLGSGVGKACFSAALAPLNFTKIWGIEIIDEMTQQAKEINNSLQHLIETSLVLSNSSMAKNPTPNYLQSQKQFNGQKLLDAMKNILLKSDGMSLSTDELGNQLCKSLGRKEYRQQIKLVKSLESFLRSDCLCAVDLSTNKESSLTLHFDPKISKIYLLRTLKDDKETSLTKEDLKINDKTSPVLAEKLSSGETIDDEAETSKMESFDKELIYRLSKEDAQLLLPCPEIVFETGDIFEVVWWTEADVAYAASLLFSDAMMLKLTEKVLLMKAGAWFITLKPLVSFSPALLKYCEAVFANAFFPFHYNCDPNTDIPCEGAAGFG